MRGAQPNTVARRKLMLFSRDNTASSALTFVMP